jgi:hypothetical protein
MNYCEFNTKAEMFVTHSQFLRLCKDAGIRDISENKISIMMSAILQTKSNLIKSI